MTLTCAVAVSTPGALSAIYAPSDTGLPLTPTRTVRFEADEGTWLSLDVSPDGTTIVFDPLGDLYTLPIAGGRATRITSGMAFDAQPRFSPDGRQLVFTSDRDGWTNVWVSDADGGRPQKGGRLYDAATIAEVRTPPVRLWWYDSLLPSSVPRVTRTYDPAHTPTSLRPSRQDPARRPGQPGFWILGLWLVEAPFLVVLVRWLGR